MPKTFAYASIIDIPDADPAKAFYIFKGWHLDSINGPVVTTTEQFSTNQKTTLYAEWVRNTGDLDIGVFQMNYLGVRNPNNLELPDNTQYKWTYNGEELPSDKPFVKVDYPIPAGKYSVTIIIEKDNAIYIERTFQSQSDSIETRRFYPNPSHTGDVIHTDCTENKVWISDLSGRWTKEIEVKNGDIIAPGQKGTYIIQWQSNGVTNTEKIIIR